VQVTAISRSPRDYEDDRLQLVPGAVDVPVRPEVEGAGVHPCQASRTGDRVFTEERHVVPATQHAASATVATGSYSAPRSPKVSTQG
jgi:hypothetical protein